MLRFLGKGKSSYRQMKQKEKRVRTQMEKEDFLLSQIDEFREKAKQLQALVSSKESKVRELQSLVDEREGRAAKLQNILNERRQEADRLNQTVQEQVDGLISKVEQQITELGGELTKSATASEEAVTAKTEEMKETLLEMKQLLEQTKNEIGDKIHEENVTCYRNIQTLFDDFGTKVDKVENMDSGVKGIKSYVKCLSWFSIVNFIVLVGFILYQLGVFF